MGRLSMTIGAGALAVLLGAGGALAQSQGRSEAGGRDAPGVGGAGSAIAPPPVRAPRAAPGACEDLWFERNGIYKANGYCFRTARGIAAFGNAGCSFDDVEAVPLSRAERARVAEIVREERALACPR